ncbi:homoserine dehydrogenase [Belliella baltica DSM 15883]|uniref:Homoserine dehydrogenase n=1 Tax=Belliella baltica (strain DSM 15883 / CIP 108006 / LMG 21964 / BA134) TaxID=866536 RepID=I3ZA06_BELBD|nr:homoserine dehydrogenase [Belliella baltica]AFL86074.1 homoserine dehydrogenase [Belliella baltica DSM 15883]
MTKRIGLFGFGVVGQGYYQIAKKQKEKWIPDTIVVKDQKKRRSSDIRFSYDSQDVFDKNPDYILELISNMEEAYEYASEALKRGITVISANKKMLSAHLPELINLQKVFGGKLLYEASVAAGIPVITNLETHFEEDNIISIEGILNGSSNYILSRIFNNGLSFGEALRLAQQKGFAESDPSFDINGSDVASKLNILILHAFGKFVGEKQIATFGIQNLGEDEIALAKSLGLKIKLIAKAEKDYRGISAYIIPTLVEESNPFFGVENEYNAVKINSEHLQDQFYQGKGAGSLPTGAAVYGDLIKARNGFGYNYSKVNFDKPLDEKLLNLGVRVLIKSKSEEIIETNIFSPEFIKCIDGFYFSVGKIKPKNLSKLNELKEVSLLALPDFLTSSDVLKSLEGIKKSEELLFK